MEVESRPASRHRGIMHYGGGSRYDTIPAEAESRVGQRSRLSEGPLRTSASRLQISDVGKGTDWTCNMRWCHLIRLTAYWPTLTGVQYHLSHMSGDITQILDVYECRSKLTTTTTTIATTTTATTTTTITTTTTTTTATTTAAATTTSTAALFVPVNGDGVDQVQSVQNMVHASTRVIVCLQHARRVDMLP